MVVLDELVSQVLKFTSGKIDSHYRVCVVIVGPPGSGKSTIAEKLCDGINKQYQNHLKQSNAQPKLIDNLGLSCESLVHGIEDMPASRQEYMARNGGILPDSVEDVNLKPTKISENGGYTVIGRGGRPNSFDVREPQCETPKIPSQIAQIIPMDGFHLTRSSLDKFQDSEFAHKRRGSPSTFDSNNYLQFCKLISKTCGNKSGVHTTYFGHVFDKLIESYNENVPNVTVPGFDHTLKDPTTGQHCIDAGSRILIFEGLYLLFDRENWSQVGEVLDQTGSTLLFQIDIADSTIEERVAKRHVQSGIVTCYEDGLDRFRSNDLLNAQAIRECRIDRKDIIKIRNE